MKKIPCIFILVGLISAHPASAGNKKNVSKSSGTRAISSGGGGNFRTGGGRHFNNVSQRSFRGNTMRSSNVFHGNNAVHSQHIAHGLNTQHGLKAQQGFNANNHAFHSQNFRGKGLTNFHGNARFGAQGRNFAGHWRGTEHFRSYHEVFRGYHRSFHDHYWWHSHYDRIVVVGGGPYYWDAGYWYPAWGYDPGYVGYVYDGPIYSYDNLPPDQVIVNVQDALQDQGYYTGDVDGQLGPKTRDAIAAYQQDHGLEVTSVVDEPTVESLGLS